VVDSDRRPMTQVNASVCNWFVATLSLPQQHTFG
jgi:hypothetical protein